MTEHLLRVDRYNRAAKINNNDAVNVLLCRLLLMEPGTNPLHPEMGVGLRSRYRMSYEEDLDQLEEEIREQILTYMPNYSSVDVECGTYEGDIRVSIKLDDTMFDINTGSLMSGNEFFANENIPDRDDAYGPDDDNTEYDDKPLEEIQEGGE